MRYFLTFAYNGSSYHGWQRQPNASSVQQTLEEALSTLLRLPIKIVGAGRTDTGVHATQMVAHFDTDIPKAQANNLPYLLNRYLDDSIAIHDIQPVHHTAHARFDALSRSYVYRIAFHKDPFRPQGVYAVPKQPNVTWMNAAAKRLLLHTDFEAFAKAHSDVKTFLCKVTHAEWRTVENGAVFDITANRFLRNMVRAIVGTLLDIGWGKIPVEAIDAIIESKNRSKAGFSVPAHGLYLTKITYPNTLYIQ